MQTTVSINGQILAPDHARVSAFDAGFTHAIGLFETFLVLAPSAPDAPPRGHRLTDHLRRLADSARTLDLFEALSLEPLAQTIIHTVACSGLSEGDPPARVRITMTPGPLQSIQTPNSKVSKTDQKPVARTPTILIVAQPATRYPVEMFERGVSATIADPRLNPLNPFEAHKTLNYWMRLHALQQASSRGAAESIFLTISNHIAGGSVSNLVLVKGTTLLTPIAMGEEPSGALSSPVRPGVTRAAVMEHARSMGLDIETKLVGIDDVLDADELMLTNSSWGVLPVVRVESTEIGSGSPGSITRDLRARWLAELGSDPRSHEPNADDEQWGESFGDNDSVV